MTASTRLSDSGRNSIWLSDCDGARGMRHDAREVRDRRQHL